jgi:hypothetical protein
MMLLILKILIFRENLLVATSQLLHGSANPIGGQLLLNGNGARCR